MKKLLLLLLFITPIIGCSESGGDDPVYTMSIYDHFPIENWGAYTTVVETSDMNNAQLSRIYSSVSLEQLTAYGKKLKSDNFQESAPTSNFSGFIKSTGQQGYVWGYEKYSEGKYLVFWMTTYISDISGTIDSWPPAFSYFPSAPKNGYTYIQTTQNIVRMYPEMTAQAVSDYTKALVNKGFKRTVTPTGTPVYIYKDATHIYVWSQQKIPLAQSSVNAFQWMTEPIVP